MEHFEKLGAFYLGKQYDLAAGSVRDDLLLYDSKDLTTHAVCVGMTGSGKTGLCVSLLEEAAIDGIPAIIIDPKGDLGNLLLTFPELKPEDFRPWVDDREATRAGVTPDEYAASTAQTWKDGLAEWGQTPERIATLKNAVDMTIYTPGSTAGVPLQVLRSFAAPPQQIVDDVDAFRERTTAATSALLALLGIDADPVRSREHILIANIFNRAWREGRDLDIAALIGEIQKPPFTTVGVVDLDTFFPPKNRLELAMSLNNLLASPSFASWIEGEPLDIKSLLHTPEGKPRLSIISISHLSDTERMFFVTILLNEVLAWVRQQPGTSSLRALLYMDEVFGYFPPTANPPSKVPMLTLLKQARAFGLGVVLATQNPVDLDYKGLSNTGTWFLGRLQTERDKIRVLEGLEGASTQAGASFDKQKMEATLSGLGKRVFLMNNVHDNQPVVFQTRWALSYLRGPLTRSQIAKLMEPRKQKPESGVTTAPVAEASSKSPAVAAARIEPTSHPVMPLSLDQQYWPCRDGEGRLVYRAALFGTGKLHFAKSTYNVDVWESRSVLSLEIDAGNSAWDQAHIINDKDLDLVAEAEESADFSALPSRLSGKTAVESCLKQLKAHLYQTQEYKLWRCAALKSYSRPGEREGDFRARLKHEAHERRDAEKEKLVKKYAPKRARLVDQLSTAMAARDREKAQAQRAGFDSVVSVGSSIFGALFGRKTISKTNIGKAATSARSVGRATEQYGDIKQADEKIATRQAALAALDAELDAELKNLEAAYDVENLELEELSIPPKKSDIEASPPKLVWMPYRIDAAGLAQPAFTSPGDV